MTTIVTLALEKDAQQWFEAQRQAYFPPALNRIPAHLSLFHSLPGTATTGHVLREAAAAQQPFAMHMDGVRSMGRGVMYTFVSPDLLGLQKKLAAHFTAFLIPQDKQPLRPHVVVQNKVEPGEAKLLLAQLQTSFVSRDVQAEGLLWWEYLGGPWRLIENFRFIQNTAHDSAPDKEKCPGFDHRGTFGHLRGNLRAQG
ncbi:MAG: 2'-5' RNA ligase family protein [Janthinobacterium lividum]